MQTPTDLTAVKRRQQATWGSGDYSVIATPLVLIAEQLCEAADLRAGARVLDVATGTGNTALAAARRGCEVTGVDYVPALVDRARERAAVERLPVDFQYGDAEALAFPDATFDAVLSSIGVMFTANQEQAAAELLRVCRPGGTIALANWTPEGFIGQLFRVITEHVPPAPGVNSPLRWGTEEGLRQLLGDGIAGIEIARRSHVFRYRSPEHWLEVFRTYYGPVERAFAALDAEGQSRLERDILDLLRRGNYGGETSLAVPSEYLEVVARRA